MSVSTPDPALDLQEQQIRARLDAAIVDGNPSLIAAERKHLVAIGRLGKDDEKHLAAEERKATTEQASGGDKAQAAKTPPEGRSAQERATTQGGTSAQKKG
jgi:hypothetical protein